MREDIALTTFQTHGARGACCRPLSQWLPRFAVAILAALAGFVSNEAWAQTQPTKSTLDTILDSPASRLLLTTHYSLFTAVTP